MAEASTSSFERWRWRSRPAVRSLPMSSKAPPLECLRRQRRSACIAITYLSKFWLASSTVRTSSRSGNIKVGFALHVRALKRWRFTVPIRTFSLRVTIAWCKATVPIPNGSSTPSGIMIPITYFSRPFRCQSTVHWPGPLNVRFGSKADIGACPRHVRFTPGCGHGSGRDVRYVPKADSCTAAKQRVELGASILRDLAVCRLMRNSNFVDFRTVQKIEHQSSRMIFLYPASIRCYNSVFLRAYLSRHQNQEN